MALTRLSSAAVHAPAAGRATRLELVRGPWLEELLGCSEAMEAVRRELLGWQPPDAQPADVVGRTAALLQDDLVVAFRAAAERIDTWAASTDPLTARRTGLLAASLAVELQLTGVRLELAVRLRQAQSSRLLTDVAGVGSTAAATGAAIVGRVLAHPRSAFAQDVDTARRGLHLVQVLHRLVQAEHPDPDID
jgi:hypothetical protein